MELLLHFAIVTTASYRIMHKDTFAWLYHWDTLFMQIRHLFLILCLKAVHVFIKCPSWRKSARYDTLWWYAQRLLMQINPNSNWLLSLIRSALDTGSQLVPVMTSNPAKTKSNAACNWQRVRLDVEARRRLMVDLVKQWSGPLQS